MNTAAPQESIPRLFGTLFVRRGVSKTSLWLMLCAPMLFLTVLPVQADEMSIWPSSDQPPACVTSPVTGAISCTGSFTNSGTPTPEDVFTYTFTTTAAENITVQTYGFGRGINAADATIDPGGFDSLVALFSGTAANATILLDGGGNTVSSADTEFLYSPGCPPAGTYIIGAVPDNSNFIPLAVNPSVSLGPCDLTDTTSTNYGSSTNTGAYDDLTAGVFQTCASLTDCNTDNGNFAVDITGLAAPVPEPDALWLLVTVLVSVALTSANKQRLRDAISISLQSLRHAPEQSGPGSHDWTAETPPRSSFPASRRVRKTKTCPGLTTTAFFTETNTLTLRRTKE